MATISLFYNFDVLMRTSRYWYHPDFQETGPGEWTKNEPLCSYYIQVCGMISICFQQAICNCLLSYFQEHFEHQWIKRIHFSHLSSFSPQKWYPSMFSVFEASQMYQLYSIFHLNLKKTFKNVWNTVHFFLVSSQNALSDRV